MNKFLKISTWKQIIQSRWLYYLNKDKDWYKERKSICDICPHNSKFSEKKDFRGKALNMLYLKSTYCSICKCPHKYICSLPENECSLYEIGEEPKWKSIWSN